MSAEDSHKRKSGMLTKLKVLFEKNRLGELLVLKGLLTPHELRQALAYQKIDGTHLGRLLVQRRMVSRRDLYGALTQQFTIRCLTWLATIFLLFSSMGVKSARAGSIRDVPAQISLASAANSAFAPVGHYAPLFGTSEKASTNLGPFTKWSGMFTRFERAIHETHGQGIIKQWQDNLDDMQGLPLEDMARRVNDLINKQDYIVDSRNWGQSDYWATPIEFFSRGGDCEDFAIAKYTSLRALGVPEDRLRITILQDEQKDIPHAVLAVYTDDDVLILDNQIKSVRSSSSIDHYRPIFSINRNAWWLHTAPKGTVLASAQ